MIKQARQILLALALLFSCLQASGVGSAKLVQDLSALERDQTLAEFRVANLYSDAQGKIMGVKLWHIPTGAPVFLLQIETLPQAFMWIDTPDNSNRGLAHSLEHLLAGKGTKGRYCKLLGEMRLSQSAANTVDDFNYYGFSSAAGLDGFFDLFHAWLDTLYHPDFSDVEAEREFYHFGVVSNPTTKKNTLVEKGRVYDEMQTSQDSYDYYFALNRRVLGEQNPLGFYSGGVPNEMRGVTPAEIRRFHAKHYRLGPTTGFIFAIHPKDNVRNFLQRISREFQQFSMSGVLPAQTKPSTGDPKYQIHSSGDFEAKIYPFPDANETDAGELRFAWKPTKVDSLVQLKLVQLFFRGLAEGEQSILYKSLIDSTTRETESGATSVVSEDILENSPFFPVWNIGISGIPGNQISLKKIEQLRSLVQDKIRNISRYPDKSEELLAFNRLIASNATAWRRSKRVAIKNPPQFGFGQAEPYWKKLFDYLEMDSSFVRSLSDEPVWQAIDEQLNSGNNIWRDLISRFRLADRPYAMASVPSAQLLESIEKGNQDRILAKTRVIMGEYHTTDDQDALSRFEQDEQAKTKAIGEIDARVPRPRFTDHPPLTLDEDVRYKQFNLLNTVPVIASIFKRPPTIDIGLSFDLSKVPRKYYKYLPIVPRCLDSLGLNDRGEVVAYSELLAQFQKQLYAFSIAYESNVLSKRADLTIRASATSAAEFQTALSTIQRIMRANYLDLSNADRLRDLIAQRLSDDDSYTAQGDPNWREPAGALRHLDDELFLAVNSQFTRAHWDARLKWLFHKPVGREDIERLGTFANHFLAIPPAVSRHELSERLAKSEATGLDAELVEYWKKNLYSFAERDLIEGFRQLSLEVQQDLTIGPARAIADLRDLQTIILNRRGLHVDVTLAASTLDELRPGLVKFLKGIPEDSLQKGSVKINTNPNPVLASLGKRFRLSDKSFPSYVGLVSPNAITGNVAFMADFPGYSELDRKTLVHVLAAKLFSGLGPQGFYMKTAEAGLAYHNAILSDSRSETILYYADRSPDIPSLVGLVNKVASGISGLRDPQMVDYALRQTFSLPRSIFTFSERGRALAADIRDGNKPDKIRRFSEAILKLRRDPQLLSELIQAGLPSIGPVLVGEEHKEQQRSARSIFFFAGTENALSDTENRLAIPKLVRLWPSDYWIE